MRDRLIELIKDVECHPEKTCPNLYNDDDCPSCIYDEAGLCNSFARKADYLLENGVIVPPFKLGQKVWYISRPRRKKNTFSAKVIYITHTDVGFIISVEIEDGHRFEMDAEDLYGSKEEAEQALENNAEL